MSGILRPSGPKRDDLEPHQVKRSGPLETLPTPSEGKDQPSEGEVAFHPSDLLGDTPGKATALPVETVGTVETHEVADPRWNGTTYNGIGGTPINVLNAYPARSSALLVNVGTTTVFLSPSSSVSLVSSFTLPAGAALSLPTRAGVWCDAAVGSVWSLAVAQTFRDG